MLARPTLREVMAFGDVSLNERSAQAAGLVSWWPVLPSRGGTVLRDLVGGQDGTLSSGVSWVEHPEAGWLMKFTAASSGNVTIPDSPSLDVNIGNTITLVTWIIDNNLTQSSALLCKPISSTVNSHFSFALALGLTSANDFEVRTSVATSYKIHYYWSRSANFTAGALTHVAVVIQTDAGASGKAKLYLDATLKTGLSAISDTSAAGLDDGARDLTMGSRHTGSYFDGYMGDTRIYNRLLSPEEIYAQWHPKTRWDLYGSRKKVWNIPLHVPGQTTELQDAKLDLSAYYQSLDDLGSWLRAHDGIETADLGAALEAWGLSLDDLGSYLAAFYQETQDGKTVLELWAESRTDLGAFLATQGYAAEDLLTNLQAVKDWLVNLGCYLEAADGILFSDLATYLAATDGTVLQDAGLRLSAVHGAPTFHSVVAQRITSIISEAA